MSAGLLRQLESLSTGNEGATDEERERHQSIQLKHQEARVTLSTVISVPKKKNNSL